MLKARPTLALFSSSWPRLGSKKEPLRHDFCLLLGNNSNHSSNSAVIEIAIVVGFREEQVWPFVSGREALEDTRDLSPQLSLIPPQGNSLI